MANEPVIVLAGNPNVGKSTVFNGLTGLRQHTGNWSGKTVETAEGRFNGKNGQIKIIDVPGTYSLMARSADEAAARNAVCFGRHDAVAVVCDATCLERNMVLALGIAETGGKVIVCVNLMDEAKRKNISLDLKKLSERTGIPFIGTSARRKKGLCEFKNAIDEFESIPDATFKIRYPDCVEKAVGIIEPVIKDKCKSLNSRWLALRMLDSDEMMKKDIRSALGKNFFSDTEITLALAKAKKLLAENGVESEKAGDIISRSIVETAHSLCDGCISCDEKATQRDRKIDRILTGKYAAYPVMLLLLTLIFWLTVKGANYPSDLLVRLFSAVQMKLSALLNASPLPDWLCDCIINGVYGVPAKVISVMLPPMAIFFPLFTVLEDLGYLPRVAYNLDKPFKSCNACGKQALTMCMGFGCNAVGVSGAKIINSPREKLLAIITNSFVPCNGKFPAIVSVITLFFIGSAGGTLRYALLLTAAVSIGIFLTFVATKLLSVTVLKGAVSSYSLELPPYRVPQVGKIIIRSVLDRTVFVLGRAVAVAVPAGIFIWCMANVTVDGASLLKICAGFVDPFARLFGIDGIILLAFILGMPANEIIIPIIIMSYSAVGAPADALSIAGMKELFLANSWTPVTAICVMLLFIAHSPCTTTLITIRKETGSTKWTLLSAALPTVTGLLLCFIVSAVFG